MANRIRVYEVAKDLGIDSKVIIKTLNELGIPVTNHMAALDSGALLAIETRFGQKGKGNVIPQEPKSADQSAARTSSQLIGQRPVPAPPQVLKTGAAPQAKRAPAAEKSTTSRPIPAPPSMRPPEPVPVDRPTGSVAAPDVSPAPRPATTRPQVSQETRVPAAPRGAQQAPATRTQPTPAARAPQVPAARGPQAPTPAKGPAPSRDRAGQTPRAPFRAQTGTSSQPASRSGGPVPRGRDVRDSRGPQGGTGPRDFRGGQGGGGRPFRGPGRRPDSRFGKSGARGKPDRSAVTGARRVTIQGPMPVRDLAPLVGVPVGIILRTLMSMGTLLSINQNVPPEIAASVAEKLGCVVTMKEPERSQEQNIIEELERPDNPEALVPRPPVVTVMGHVDHGKTSLLDAIRHTNVTAKEAGGITQHIGASVVERHGVRLIFLDTPGHEAFTAMRARGAKVTDLAVLVVAADDGVMPQTIEAINHAKAAKVAMVVAMNKMDKPGAKPDRVKQQLSDAGLVPEDWGGDTVVVPVSAKTGDGIDELFDMINLVSEMQEVKTDPTRAGRGYIIESLMDKGKGPVATALIKSGMLRVGDVLITDTTWGRIRAMFDARGRAVKKATPATPVEIIGMEGLPQAGDLFVVVADEKTAKEVTERRQLERREQEMGPVSRKTLDDLLKERSEEEKRDLEVIVKADVQGSMEAILQALGKIKGGEVELKVIHSGVGGIIASDVILAKASNARILGFNVRPDANVRALADSEGIEIRTYRVIYDLLDDIGDLLKGLVKPKFQEVILGRAEIRQTFHVPKVGVVSGCYVTNGKVARQSDVRLLRDGVVVYEGRMSSLRRFKDDVNEVSQGYECGIGLERYQDIKPGDVIEAFTTKEIKPA